MIKLRHVGITVTDIERSLKLYRDYFGFKITWDQVEEGEFIDGLSSLSKVKVRTVKLCDNCGGVIELLQYYSHKSSNKNNLNLPITNIGCSHFAVTVEDINTCYLNLKKMGLPFNKSPQLSPDGKAKVCFLRDFDGTLIELVEVCDAV